MAFAGISPRGRGGGALPYLLLRVYAVEQGVVLGSWTSNRVYWRFHYLASWAASLFAPIEAFLKSVKVSDKRYTFQYSITVTWKLLNSVCNETNQGHTIRSLVWNRVLKGIIFVLNRASVWKPRRSHLYPNFSFSANVSPPPPPLPPDHLRPSQLLNKVSYAVAIVMDRHGIVMKFNPQQTTCSCYHLIILSGDFLSSLRLMTHASHPVLNWTQFPF